MNNKLKKNDWFTGHYCPTCNEEVWHKKGDDDFVCLGCDSRYNFEPTNNKSKEENENAIKTLWEKTIFPEKIKDFKEKKQREREIKKEEEQLINEIKREAKQEALKDLKPALKEQFKKTELDRLSGKKKEKNWAEKLVAGFDMGNMNKGQQSGKKDIAGMMGMGAGSSDNSGKKDIAGMMGFGGSSQNSVVGDDKIKSLLGQLRPGTERKVRGPKRKLKKRQPKEYELNAEEKIRRILG